MKQILMVSILLLSTVAMVSQAAERPKVGLALSGGGARGAAHIGVLRELERQRIPIDYIAGTSMGAIVGGLYASGVRTAEIEQVLIETDWDDIFKDRPPRRDASIRRKFDDRVFQINKELGIKDGSVRLPSGLIQGQKLQLLLDRLFLPVADAQDFDQLPIPFRAVATDLATGHPAILGQGSLSTAIRASMSVPSVFATVKYGEQILVDGGISNNLPVDVVRDMGADVVIAVDIGTPLLTQDELESAIGVTHQLSNILVRRTTNAQIANLHNEDILITPELGGFSSADFKGAKKIVPNGVEATRALAGRLAPLALTLEQTPARQTGADESPPPVVSFIRIENDSPLADAYLQSKLTQRLGQPLDFDQLEKDIGIIYGLEIFQTIDYAVVQESGETGLVLRVRQKPWGPRYLQFGLRFSSDLADENNLAVTLGYTVTPLNLWNGEWRTILQLGEEPGLATEFNQPLGVNSAYYTNIRLGYSNKRFNIFEDGVKINQTRVRKTEVIGSFGREFGAWGDLRVGVTRFISKSEVKVGVPAEPNAEVDGGEFFARVFTDTLDSAFFPSSGVLGLAGWRGSRTELGADSEFDQALFDLNGAVSWHSHTLQLGARYLSTVQGQAPIQSSFRLGGLFDLPGFVENELSGQNLYLLRTGYMRKLSNLFSTSPYLGLTVQYGQVAQTEEELDLSDGIVAGSVWLGWDSFIGPLYVGYGQADTGNQSFYLILGSSFSISDLF